MRDVEGSQIYHSHPQATDLKRAPRSGKGNAEDERDITFHTCLPCPSQFIQYHNWRCSFSA